MQIDDLKWPIYFILGKKFTLSCMPRAGIRWSFVEPAFNFLVERGFSGGIVKLLQTKSNDISYNLSSLCFSPMDYSTMRLFLFLLRSSFWSGLCSSSDSVLICGREQGLEFLFRGNTEHLKVGIQGWDGKRTGNWMHLWDSVHVMGSGLLVRWCFHP